MSCKKPLEGPFKSFVYFSIVIVPTQKHLKNNSELNCTHTAYLVKIILLLLGEEVLAGLGHVVLQQAGDVLAGEAEVEVHQVEVLLG